MDNEKTDVAISKSAEELRKEEINRKRAATRKANKERKEAEQRAAEEAAKREAEEAAKLQILIEQERRSEKIQDIIVWVVSILTILMLLFTIGFEGIKFWLSTPFVWKEDDTFQVSVVDWEETEGSMSIRFEVTNSSLQEGVGGNIYVMVPGIPYDALEIFIIDRMDPFEKSVEYVSFSDNGTSKHMLKALQGKQIDEFDFEYRLHELRINGEVVKQNHGWFKIIAILIVSILAAVVLHFGWCKSMFLKIVLKLCRVPIILVVIMLAFVFNAMANAPAQAPTNSDSYKNSAAKRYKDASNLKAGYTMQGNTKGAANAQRQMDSAMADMVSPNSSAARRYKTAADFKAGYTMQGNAKGAARAQSQMDSALADMISKK